MSNSATLRSFTNWLNHSNQNVEIHPSLDIRSHAPDSGYGVFATSTIAKDEIVAKIPKACILSISTCAISNFLDEAGLEGMLGVCFAYLYERSLGAQSPWYQYISICPTTVPISKLWTKDEQRMIRGTEVAMVGGTSLSDFKELYKSEVKPFLRKHSAELGTFQKLSFEEFCEGMSIVGSRAFEVDAFHDLAMCPFADMLDHDINEHVHFQTTYDVCPECGAHEGCEHDPTDPEADSSMADGHDASESDGLSDSSDRPDTCEFIVCRTINSGDQVMNTYGDCGNDVLLARYGFSLLDNPHDKISLGPEVTQVAGEVAYREWWDLNGHNLLSSLKQGRPDQDKPESSKDSDGDSNDSFMQGSGGKDNQPDLDDETLEFEDLCYLEYSGIPSQILLHYLFLRTIPLASLKSKSGPEVKAHFEVLLSAFRYVQPGRMPLPTYLFTDAIRDIAKVVQVLHAAIEKRMQRYPTHKEEFRLNLDRATIEGLEIAVSTMRVLDERQKRLRYAAIVRINELKILQRSQQYLNTIGVACQWLLDR